ncbi:serine hydrolase domain-containing protein [Actinophytocola sp.]|uniref:serine hydrolase domain-containing protein n=1 Tax=Actinophytocola sp. TaxID=1872138 RepID=UPI002ED21C69
MKRKLGALLAVTTAVLACTSPQPTSTRRDDRNTQSLVDFLDQTVRTKRFRGAVEVRRGEDVVLRRGFDRADWAGGTPNGPDTRFLIASLTKQFTSLAVLILQERGKLRVSDAVCAHLPDCPPDWQPITIEHLLTHTSGLYNYNDDQDAFQERFAGMPPTPAQLIQTFAARPLEYTPGSRFEYTNSGYVLLGHLIEKVTGERYGDFLRREILDPLGMSNSGYDPGTDHALTYEDWTTPAPHLDEATLFSAGGMYSTVTDLGRWQQFLLTGRPAIGGRGSVADLLRPRVALTSLEWYCYGLFAQGTRSAVESYWHDGRDLGISTYLEFNPTTEVSVTVLANIDTDSINIGRNIVSLLDND